MVKSQVSLTPTAQTLATGSSASLVANVTSASGALVVGGSVVFSVDSGPDAGATLTGTTDSSGNVTFSYKNGGTTGADSVSATYTDTTQTPPVSQKALATVTWSSSPTTLTTTLHGPMARMASRSACRWTRRSPTPPR